MSMIRFKVIVPRFAMANYEIYSEYFPWEVLFKPEFTGFKIYYIGENTVEQIQEMLEERKRYWK